MEFLELPKKKAAAKKHQPKRITPAEISELHRDSTAPKGFIKSGIVLHEGLLCSWFVKPGKTVQEHFVSLEA